MNSIRPDKIQKVTNLIEFTGYNLDENQAIGILKSQKWNVEASIDHYLNNSQKFIKFQNLETSSNRSSIPNTNIIRNLFDQYSDANNKNLIDIEGIEKFCSDLNYEPGDRQILILAWKFNAQVQGQFTSNEFTNGCKLLNASSLDQLKEKLEKINSEIDYNINLLKDLYLFTFTYAKDPKYKSLDAELAVIYWDLLFSVNPPANSTSISPNKIKISNDGKFTPNFVLLSEFLKFINEKIEKDTKFKVISKDQWNLLFDFAGNCEKNIQEYDECSAWPVLIDEFVAWYKIENIKNLQENELLSSNSINGLADNMHDDPENLEQSYRISDQKMMF